MKHLHWYKCSKVIVNNVRALNETDLNYILEATKIKAYEEILNKLNELL